jgi:DNA polymerase-4
VTLKVRYSDFTTITRSHSKAPSTRDADDIAARAVALLERTEAGQRPVRLLGVSVHNLIDPSGVPEEERAALPLFDTGSADDED